MKATIGLRLVSVANKREHWTAKARRAKAHRLAGRAVAGHYRGRLPCVVTITRHGAGVMDSDNFASAAKALRDGIADALGVDDGSPLVTWRYGQVRAKRGTHLTTIEIEPVSE